MKLRSAAGAACAALVSLPLLVSPVQAAAPAPAAAPALTAAAAEDDYKVLVVGKTLGFRHSHIDETTASIIALGAENGFTVDVWDPPNTAGGWWGTGSPGQPELTLPSTPFTTAENLSQYATIAFVSPVDNTNNAGPDSPRLLDPTETAALQGYIHNGGGFFGLHAASDTMHNVPWYGQLIGGGAYFLNHPAQQQATMRLESPGHPSTTMLPDAWSRFDEWYNYKANPRPFVHVLMTLDERTYSPGGGAMGADHPIAWCHNFEGGRSWYQGAGHVEGAYEDPIYLQHILGGLEWTAGRVSGGGDCVTFYEVDNVLADLGVPAAIKALFAADLDAAQAAAEADSYADALSILTYVRAAANGMPADVAGRDLLRDKIDDLIEWQAALLADAVPPADLTAVSACLGSKAVVTVRARVTNTEPVSLTFTAPQGAKTYADLAPKKLVAHNFAAGTAVDAGEVTVTSVVPASGKLGTITLPYQARSCA